MPKLTNKQYVEITAKLPPEIRDVIASGDTVNHITLIGKKHNLHIDKIGELVDVSYDVMMGIVATKDFVKELQDALQMNALEAAVLARDVDENVFKPIKDMMTHLYAGRAPYRPSSSLVEYYDEDDEHPALDKNTLLKEIEDPTPAEVKKETVVTVSKGVGVQAIKEKMPESIPVNLTTSHTNALEVVEYHEELRNGEKKKAEIPSFQVSGPNLEVKKEMKNSEIISPPTPSYLKRGEDANNLTTSHTNTLSAGDSILNQIASLKLNQAFVMPKGPEGIRELGKLEQEQLKNTPPTSQKETSATPSFTIPKPTIESAPTNITSKPGVKVDPYRERI